MFLFLNDNDYDDGDEDDGDEDDESDDDDDDDDDDTNRQKVSIAVECVCPQEGRSGSQDLQVSPPTRNNRCVWCNCTLYFGGNTSSDFGGDISPDFGFVISSPTKNKRCVWCNGAVISGANISSPSWSNRCLRCTVYFGGEFWCQYFTKYVGYDISPPTRCLCERRTCSGVQNILEESIIKLNLITNIGIYVRCFTKSNNDIIWVSTFCWEASFGLSWIYKGRCSWSKHYSAHVQKKLLDIHKGSLL